VALVVSLPLAWLLSYAASLPFFLGVFFFALFGLVIGAVVYRIASPARPYGRWTVFLGTTALVAVCWGLSIAKESHDFAVELADEAVRRARDIAPRTAAQYRVEVADSIRAYLREHHPPGGILGYVHWTLTRAEIKKGDIPLVEHTLKRSQGRWSWAIRVVLSIGLLAFGVSSQVFPLSSPRPTTTSTRPAFPDA